MSALAVVVTLADGPGALERTLSLLRRRALPVHTLSVSQSALGRIEVSIRFGALTTPDDRVVAELKSLVDAVSVRRVIDTGVQRAREMALARTSGEIGPWPEVDHAQLTLRGGGAVELVGSPAEIDRALRLMQLRGVLTAVARTGEIFFPALPMPDNTTHTEPTEEGDSHGSATA